MKHEINGDVPRTSFKNEESLCAWKWQKLLDVLINAVSRERKKATEAPAHSQASRNSVTACEIKGWLWTCLQGKSWEDSAAVLEAPPSLASRVTGIFEDKFIDQWTADILSFNAHSASWVMWD